MTKNRLRFAVLGAGGGGQAMAAYLARAGFPVHLYNRTAARIAEIKDSGGLMLEHEGSRSFVRLELVTTNLRQALRHVDLVMIVVPACAHREVASLCAAHLRPGQVVVLNPGRTGGALEFAHVLEGFGAGHGVVIAEAQTFLFASRVVRPGCARIYGVKRSVPLAALPASETPKILSMLRRPFPQFTNGETVLHTSLDNIGAIFHPAPTILNAARIESPDCDFEYYREGISPSVARVILQMDRERIDVARVLGVPARSALGFLREAYGVTADNLYDGLRGNPSYAGISAPSSVSHRYVFEDVPSSLVPLASLGDLVGVPTPTIKSMIHLASLMHDCDYWSVGRTVGRLGLSGLSIEEIWDLVTGEARGELVG